MDTERRNLALVIDAILQIIPEDEMQLRMDLRDHYNEALYKAPEIQEWTPVAKTLQLHMKNKLDEQWVKDSLALWKNDATKKQPKHDQLDQQTNE
jgi:hypothetical protein